MRKFLLSLMACVSFQTFAQTSDWALCDLIGTTTKIEINDFDQIVYTVSTQNTSEAILPEQLCVYVNTENESVQIDGGACHEPFDSGVTQKTQFEISLADGFTEFDACEITVEVKLKSNTNEEDYCIIEKSFNLCALLSLEEIILHETPISVERYDISGRVITEDYRGLYIYKATYSNGYIHTEKRYQNR